jgi:hypothetical protein
MFLISIFKKENRRSNQARRKSDNPKHNEREKRSPKDRRDSKDRRNDVGNRSGLYYKISDNQKDTVDTIISILEQESLKEK